MNFPSHKYTTGRYFQDNPTWDQEDSAWKAELVSKMLERHGLNPSGIVEVGCGAAGVLAGLRRKYPLTDLVGYDIAPDAARFWSAYEGQNITLKVGDFLKVDTERFDVMLLLDVIEHIVDPFGFLMALHGRAGHYVIHLPLDLSASSVLREAPLLYSRHKVGHIHYFTKGLALSLLEECGFEVIEARYTGAAFSTPQKSWRTRLAMLPRYLAYRIDRDLGARLFGGETLLLLAKSRD
ncbi:MAG TPA: class I SAM-dependent methyltransferase [Smithellaceae bacterium]|nr:class I SAM-dependent methyltransferase [Smithellaceae bacterium]